MRPITWAIRVTMEDGRLVFVRQHLGGVLGRGPIATFHAKAQADIEAEAVRRNVPDVKEVTVIERSHGRRWPD